MHSLFLTPAYGILVTMTEDIQILKEIEKAAALCEKQYTREELRKLLSGHLCRCTGYENILNAVEKTMQGRSPV